MIEQSSLFKLRIFDTGVNGEKTASHLQHVIDIARLVGPSVYALGELSYF
ncbi:MAG TPA: hypothetical protein VF088_16395 [Pyrinomonadaceae bacterium]